MSSDQQTLKAGAAGVYELEENFLNHEYEVKCEEIKKMVDTDSGLPPKAKTGDERIRDNIRRAMIEPVKFGWKQHLVKSTADDENGITRSLRRNFKQFLSDLAVSSQVIANKTDADKVRSKTITHSVYSTPSMTKNSKAANAFREVEKAFEQVEYIYQQDRSAFELCKVVFGSKLPETEPVEEVEEEQQPIEEYSESLGYLDPDTATIAEAYEMNAVHPTSYYEGQILVQSPVSYRYHRNNYSATYGETAYPVIYSEVGNRSLNEILVQQQQDPSYHSAETTYTNFQEFCSKLTGNQSTIQTMYPNIMSSPIAYTPAYPVQTAAAPATTFPVALSPPVAMTSNTVVDFFNTARPTRYRYNTATPTKPTFSAVVSQLSMIENNRFGEIMQPKSMSEYGTNLKNIIATASDLMSVTGGTAIDVADYEAMLNGSGRFSGSVRVR